MANRECYNMKLLEFGCHDERYGTSRTTHVIRAVVPIEASL